MGKKAIAGILFFVLAAAVAAGMFFLDKQKEQEQMDVLCGVWEMEVAVPREDVRTLLESNDFYDEEITLADLGALSYVQTVTFRGDGTYRFSVDTEASQARVEEFFRGGVPEAVCRAGNPERDLRCGFRADGRGSVPAVLCGNLRNAGF